MAQSLIRGAVVGASGYVGGELIRYLLGHPLVSLQHVYGLGSIGASLDSLHPALRGFSDLHVEPLPTAKEAWPDIDVIFLSLPHGESMKVVPGLPETPRIIDLSGDFRVKDGELFERYYGFSHVAGDWHQKFTYGLTELFSNRISESRLVANPGCFATACLIGVAPLVRSGLIGPRLLIDAKTGSSGAGVKPQKGTHHPERAEGFLAYKMFKHQHLAEITEALRSHAPEWQGKLLLQAHSAPMVRGIFASIYAQLLPDIGEMDVSRAFKEHYDGAPFIRQVEGSPNVRYVHGTNFCDVSYAVSGDELIVFVAIDNLGKGAAGQAIQNMNLMFGHEEKLGLWRGGMIP